MSQNCYTVGQTVRLSVSFSDAAGTALDPALVTLKVKDPSQAVASYTLASGLIRDAVGAFHADVATTLSGAHLYRWEGTAPGCAAESQFFTETSF